MLRMSVSVAFVLLIATFGVAPVKSSDARTAIYRGTAIPLSEVSRHHCHDLAYPVIRCFDTANERDLDIAGRQLRLPLASASTSGTFGSAGSALGTASIAYVTFYSDANFGGYSFTSSVDVPSLVDYGWNDIISSFKSLNGQRPKWWRDINYGGTAWQWAAGASLSYVGDAANDQFSSVRNVP